MNIEFQETSGWWLKLSGREVREAVDMWLEEQGCVVEQGRKDGTASVTLKSKETRKGVEEGRVTHHELLEVAMHVPVRDGSITFRGDVGPKESHASD